MKVSHAWLQKFFAAPLPKPEELADILTFHSSEIEEIEGDMLDVKVLPDRAAYMLSHRGVALEIAAAANLELSNDPLALDLPVFPKTDELTVTVCDDTLVPRYMGALVRGVKVGSSPDWLKEAIESVGQRSINNVVDATNYVMLNLGQPLHAFDAGKLTNKEGYAINVRRAYEGEKITTLTGEEYALPEDTLLITDAHTDRGLGIAGVKGGKVAEVTEATTDLIIEAATFDGAQVRRAAQALKLFTDASLRFQNRPSAELPAYGMRDVLALITDVAGGEVVGGVDHYPSTGTQIPVSVSLDRINGRLGTTYTASEVSSALTRLLLPHTEEGTIFTITPPFYRRDVVTAEDVAEEVGRILGYEQVPSTPLPDLPTPPNLGRFNALEGIKDLLRERGYVELSTQAFSETGDIELANPLQTDRPFLRANLTDSVQDALVRAKREAPRTLGPEPSLKLFELGTIFTKEGEKMALTLGYEPLTGKASKTILDDDIAALKDLVPGLISSTHDGSVAELILPPTLSSDVTPARIALGPFRPYSIYPFALRDIAVWTPAGTEETEVSMVIQKEAGDILVRMDLFDRFEKDGRTSFAFRLVFEAPDRTLSDADLDPVMERMTQTLNAKEGYSVR